MVAKGYPNKTIAAVLGVGSVDSMYSSAPYVCKAMLPLRRNHRPDQWIQDSGAPQTEWEMTGWPSPRKRKYLV